VHDQEATRLRDALAVGDEAIGNLLAIGNEFSAHGQCIVHARFAALLFLVVGRLGGDRYENKTRQHERKRCADTPCCSRCLMQISRHRVAVEAQRQINQQKNEKGSRKFVSILASDIFALHAFDAAAAS
jgi:hypothetical protein